MNHDAAWLLPIETCLLDYDELLDAFFKLLRLIFPNIPFGKAELRFKAYRVSATKNALPDALSDLSTVLLRDYVAMYYSSAAYLTNQTIYRLFDRFSVNWIFSTSLVESTSLVDRQVQLVTGFTRLYAVYRTIKPALERREFFLSRPNSSYPGSDSDSESEYHTDSDYETTLDADGFPEYFPTLKQKSSSSSLQPTKSSSSSSSLSSSSSSSSSLATRTSSSSSSSLPFTATTTKQSSLRDDRPPRYEFYSRRDTESSASDFVDATSVASIKTWRTLYPEACRAMGMKGYGYIVRMLLYGPQKPVTGKTMTLSLLSSSSSSFGGGGKREKLVVPAWPFKQHHLSLSYNNVTTSMSHIDAGGVLTYCRIVDGDCRAEAYYHRLAARNGCALRMLREPFMVRFADRRIGVISTEPFSRFDMTASDVPKVAALLARMQESRLIHHNVSLNTLVRTLEGEPRLINFNHAWHESYPYHWSPEQGDWEDRINTTYKGWTGVVPDQPSYEFDTACLVASVFSGSGSRAGTNASGASLRTDTPSAYALFDACYRLLVNLSGGVINIGADGIFFRTGNAVPRRLSALSSTALAWLRDRRRR